jgi:hypothetical protein
MWEATNTITKGVKLEEECGGVLVPLKGPVPVRRVCFVDEHGQNRKQGRPFNDRELRLEVDHMMPVSWGGKDGPTHLAHYYCQRVQAGSIGGLIGGLVSGPANGRKAVESGQLARVNATRTTEQRRAAGRKNAESGQIARLGASNLGNHTRHHANRSIVNESCALCAEEGRSA